MIWDIWIAEQKLRSSESVDVLRRTVEYLGQSGDRKRAVALLLLAHGWLEMRFRDDNETVRKALVAQGTANCQIIVSALQNFPDSLSPYIDEETRRLLLSVLVRLDAPEAFDAIVHATRDKNRVLRRDAVKALAQKNDKRAAPLLLPLFADKDREVRQETARALGSLGDRLAIPQLQKALIDWDSATRTFVSESLRMLGWQPQTLPERAQVAVADQDIATLETLGAEAAPFLVLLLEHGYDADQEFALSVLDKIGDARALPDVMRSAQENPVSAQQSLDVLQTLLERDGKNAPVPVLEQIANFPVIRGGERDYDGRIPFYPLDAEPVRRAAQAELARRTANSSAAD